MCSRFADVQDYLAVLNMLTRHADTVNRRVNDYVRRVTVVAHPLMHGANQVRSF